MIKKWKITLPELTGKTRRNAYVYVPDFVQDYPDLCLPVLYMFDGHNVFFDKDATYGKSWGMLEFMEENDVPLIIAAVECDHSPDHGRLSEYSPFTFSEKGFGHVEGRGHTTMEWFVHKFKPYIDARYPTLPDRRHTFIAGSSMGGLMSLYAVTAYNHVFSRAAALSPSVWVAPRRLDRLFCQTEFSPDTVVYMDYGAEELCNHPDMLRLFTHTTGRLMERGVMVNSRIVPGGQHTEASWEQQIPFFIQTLLYGIEFYE